MASLNVAEWSPDQVAEWLKGLGTPVERYVPALRARGLDGAKLLTLRCDDLEYLGMRIIGHQELLLEAVEHLRNFQYEVSRECVQQLALRVSVAAGGLARALGVGGVGGGAGDVGGGAGGVGGGAGGVGGARAERLETQALMDVARAVQAVKTLVWWLARWPPGATGAGGAGGGVAAALRERAAALLALCLEAATCAQRDRFAEQPARAVAAAAAAAAAVADHIIQEVADPLVLQPASLDAVTLRQGDKPLGFSLVPSFCGHLQLAAIRFGSPAHASGAVHEGDEIVQVGGQCVVGWSGVAVERLCVARGPDLQLRLRRRGARAPAALPRDRSRLRASGALAPAPAGPAPPAAAPEPAGDASSSDSEPLSPPASPTLPLDRTRLYPPAPRARAPLARRHTVSGAGPARRPLALDPFWQELRRRRGAGRDPPDRALYRRDKAVSCSTGLELSPRPRTSPAVPPGPGPGPGPAPAPVPADDEARRGKLDKSHSTPAYDFDRPSCAAGSLVTQIIPESPTGGDSPAVLVHSAEKADQILDFKKSSSQIGEAILQQRGRRRPDDADPALDADARRPSPRPRRDGDVESPLGDNVRVPREEAGRGSLVGRAPPPSPPPRPAPAPLYPALRPVRAPPAPASPPRPLRLEAPPRHITKRDIRVIPSERRELPPLNGTAGAGAGLPVPRDAAEPGAAPGVRGIFPAYKSKSLKKKNSLLAKRRAVAACALAGRGAGGCVWQRVRARGAQQPRWARRYLLLADTTLYAYRSADGSRADCMIRLAGFTAAAAGEVKSRPHAFKVYHTGTAFYFACESAAAARAWLDLITRATHDSVAPQTADLPKQYSETEYSTDSDGSERPRERERERERERDAREKEKDKSKFGSLKKLTHRMHRSESTEAVGAASLDRKYLRFFSRAKHKDDAKPKSKPSNVPVPTEHYRSYRRVSQAEGAAPAAAGAPPPPRAPKPHNYIHASNPNLLEFESSLGARAAPPPAPPAPRRAPDSLAGFVTLEEFMLKKQEEERRQVYTDRVLLGVERGRRGESLRRRRRERDAPLALYGAAPDPPPPPPDTSPGSPAVGAGAGVRTRSLPRTPPPPPERERERERAERRDLKPVSVRGDDGYEKIVYAEESPPGVVAAGAERWRDSLRRNDKVQPGARRAAAANTESVAGAGAGGVSRLRLMFGRRDSPRQESAGGALTPPSAGASGGAGGGAGAGAGAGAGGEWAWRTHHYPHLQCPPTFQPETYSLASRLPRPPPD